MMEDLFKQHFAIVFPIFFAAMWLAVTTLLGALSGWYALMQRYPDREEKPLLHLWGQSGTMGAGVGMSGILKLSVCPSGLRVGMFRVFGVFCHDFFVPWEEIRIRRKTWLFMALAELRFGDGASGKLTVQSNVADQLARAAGGDWPEPGMFPRQTTEAVFWDLAKQWAILTTFASLFFISASRLASAPGHDPVGPPVVVAIAFPAIVFGIVSLIRFFVRLRQ
jgi:hypothetical protein